MMHGFVQPILNFGVVTNMTLSQNEAVSSKCVAGWLTVFGVRSDLRQWPLSRQGELPFGHQQNISFQRNIPEEVVTSAQLREQFDCFYFFSPRNW